MAFHHASFLLLFLASWAAYWLLPALARLAQRRGGEPGEPAAVGSRRDVATSLQHAVLMLASVAFYLYAGPLDTAILIGTVGVCFLFAAGLDHASGRHKSLWLALGVGASLGILGYFKYRGFVVSNVNRLLGTRLPVAAPGIPLGISFYVFQLVAYLTDLKRGQIAREKSFGRLLLYVLFFPHSQAGPIMRPGKFLPQFYGPKAWSSPLAKAGAWWILLGLTKKCLADALAPAVDELFALAAVGPVASWQAWRAALGFGFQIYGDFSGYSDMAVGLGLLLGYRLDLNFAQPYTSSDPSEFWRRWHITLSSWLRDYLFLPIAYALSRRLDRQRYAGIRVDHLTYAVATLATMLLGGLWHGASWMFVLWGAIHGLLLVAHRARPKLFRRRPLGVLLTFLLVTAAWVPFRSADLGQCWRILGAMVGLGRGAGDSLGAWAWQALWTACIVGAFWLELGLVRNVARLERVWTALPAPVRGLVLGSGVTAIVLSLSSQTSFVYFRF